MRLTIAVAVLAGLLTLAGPAAAQYSDPTGSWDVDWSEREILTFPQLTSGTTVFDVVRSSSGNWSFVERAAGETCMAVPTQTRTSPSSAHAECGSFVGSITWYEVAGPNGLETVWFFMELTYQGHSDGRRWVVGRRQPSSMSVSITAPTASTVSGTTTVSAQVTNATGASNTFTLAVDGNTVATQTVSGGAASFAWNTTTVANGTHALRVTVRDQAGRVASASRQVTVSNVTTSALKVYITQPKSAATLSGTNWVVLWLEGTTSTSNTYTLTVDGLQVTRVTASSRGPISIAWDTRLVSNGTRTLTAIARDSAGKTGTASISIVVRN
jgi:hypothetical protein